MIRTIREELLDQVLFWNQLDLERKLSAYRIYYRWPAIDIIGAAMQSVPTLPVPTTFFATSNM